MNAQANLFAALTTQPHSFWLQTQWGGDIHAGVISNDSQIQLAVQWGDTIAVWAAVATWVQRIATEKGQSRILGCTRKLAWHLVLIRCKGVVNTAKLSQPQRSGHQKYDTGK